MDGFVAKVTEQSRTRRRCGKTFRSWFWLVVLVCNAAMAESGRKRMKTQNGSGRSFFDGSNDLGDDASSDQCFSFYDEAGRGFLDRNDFRHVVKSLLPSADGDRLVSVSDSLFGQLDCDLDGKLDGAEFRRAWQFWIKPLVQPVSALLVVDMQNDFIDGSLAMKNCPAKQDANDIVPVINGLLDSADFDLIVYTKDWHPGNHISFFDNLDLYRDLLESNDSDVKMFDTVVFKDPYNKTVDMPQKLWPVHCVQGQNGSEIHPGLSIAQDAVFIKKGTDPGVDSYSAFFDNLKIHHTELDSILKSKGVTHVFVCGVALDVCVSFTVLDSLDLGYATVLIQDASVGTDTENIQQMEDKVVIKSGVIANASDVKSLASGKDRKVEFSDIFARKVKQCF